MIQALVEKGVRLTVNVQVQDREGALLAVTRKKDPSKVCFPGGWVEASEFIFGNLERTLQLAATRELQEETGLHATSIWPIFACIDEVGTWCTMFKALLPGNRELVPEPGTTCIWLPPEQFMARCAFPEYYVAARKAGAF